MRYLPAKRRPGRNLPSLKYCAELGGRDEVADTCRGGNGEDEVLKSSVANSSLLEVGAPQAAQKRALAGISLWQEGQVGMSFRYSVPRWTQTRGGPNCQI